MAKSLTGYQHVETDMWFYRNNNKYMFEPSRLGEAHKGCQDLTRNLLAAGNNVVVSNTFTQVWEMQPYLDLAKELKCSVFVMTALGEYKNEHGVPPNVIEKMKARWEKF